MKKVISLFLSLVMLISITAGIDFNSYAKDEIRDKNFAEFDAKVKNLMETVSPSIFKTLAQDGDKSAVIAELKGSAYDKLDDYYFSFLNSGDDADVSFYALYNFCEQNKNAEGELGTYAQDTLAKLKALGAQYNTAANALATELDTAYNALGEDYGAYLPTETTLTKSETRNINVNGTPLAECPAGKAQFLIDYINAMFETYGSPERAENVADVVYYFMMDEGGMQIVLARYFGTALLGGAQVKADGSNTVITWNNYEDVFKDIYPFAVYLSDSGMSEADYNVLTDDDKAIVNEHYRTYLGTYLLMTLFPSESSEGSVRSRYYVEMCLGLMVLTGSFGDLDACKEYVNAQKITDAQFTEFCRYLKEELKLTGYNKSKITNYLQTNSPFSPLATKYFLGYITDSGSGDYVSLFFEACLKDDLTEAKSYVLNDTDYSKVYIFLHGFDGNPLPMIDRLNAMMASEVLVDRFGTQLTSKGIKARDAAEPALCSEDFFNYNYGIKPGIKNKYSYSNYAPDKALMIAVANAQINTTLDSYLSPTSTYGSMINIVISGLIESELDIYTTFHDVWSRLYATPTETAMSLTPALTILADELVAPVFFNRSGDAFYGLLDGFLLNKKDAALYPYSQAAGDTKIGIGSLSIDLNKAVPAINAWLMATTDSAKNAAASAVGYYKAPYDTTVPRFTNIYIADRIIAKSSIGTDKDARKRFGYFKTAVDEYVANHGDDARLHKEGAQLQTGLNNVFVALPQIIDRTLELMGADNIHFSTVKTVDGKQVNTFAQSLKAVNNKPVDEIIDVVDTSYVRYQRTISMFAYGNQEHTISDMLKLSKELGLFMFFTSYDSYYAEKYNYNAFEANHVHTPAKVAVKEKIVPATCTKAGSYDEVYYCTVCGKVTKRTKKTIAKTAHIAVAVKAVPATFNKAGKTAGKRCKVCGKVLTKQKVVKKLVSPSITKTKADKRAFTVSWKKAPTVAGYQIQYSLKSNFKSAKSVRITKDTTTSKKIKNLKAGKKYYVRVRAYKKINGKTQYSKWSAKKAVTTK